MLLIPLILSRKFNNTILTSTADLTTMLNSMMEKVKKITDASAWSLLFNDEPFFDIVRFRTSKKLRKFRFQKGVGIAGWILEKNTPLIINDVKKDKRYNKEVDKFSNLNIKSLICAPLKIKERVIGVLRLINKKGEDAFTDDDISRSLGDHMLDAGADQGGFRFEKRHGLPLHVGSHQGPVGIVMLQERDQRGR